MVVVSPHLKHPPFRLRAYRASLVASLLALSVGASSASAQETKSHHAKGAFRPDKHKAEKKGTAAPEGKVAPTKPAPAEVHRAQTESVEEQMATRGPTRLDFDDRLIQGQGNKIGSVYLYDRKNLPLRSMVHQRLNFRDQIVSDSVAGPVIE